MTIRKSTVVVVVNIADTLSVRPTVPIGGIVPPRSDPRTRSGFFTAHHTSSITHLSPAAWRYGKETKRLATRCGGG